jgi:hypothetical protein
MGPRLKKALRVPTPADRGPGRPWRAGSPPPAPIDPDLPSEMALRTAREVKAHAPHCRVVFTVYEMKRLGRDAAELTALADHLTAHGLILEMLAGPLPGIYDPTGPGKLLFAFLAAMAETERENIRESTLEGLDTAARKGKHGGRPPSSPTTCSTPCAGAARAASPSGRSDPTCSSPPASAED